LQVEIVSGFQIQAIDEIVDNAAARTQFEPRELLVIQGKIRTHSDVLQLYFRIQASNQEYGLSQKSESNIEEENIVGSRQIWTYQQRVTDQI
jgi:hypothetical protein